MKKKTFVLVHGAWHGSWCWEKVVFRLQDAGHNAIALDLPGRAGDRTRIENLTLESYAKKICRVVNLQPESVILVGHSMGGLSITQAAEYCPDKIRTLVYLCAFLPKNGQRLRDTFLTDTELHAAGQDGQSLLPPYLIRNQPKGYSFLKASAPLKEIFYHDCSEEDVKRAKAMLVPEPIQVGRTLVHTTRERFGRISKVYITCLEDKTITKYHQQKMYQATPCQEVISMNTSHSPFLSASEELISHFIAIECL